MTMAGSGGKNNKAVEAYEKELLGKHIKKSFGDLGMFKGVISDVWCKGSTIYAHIKYEDGDEEDLTPSDVRCLLVKDEKKKLASGGATIKKEPKDDKKRKIASSSPPPTKKAKKASQKGEDDESLASAGGKKIKKKKGDPYRACMKELIEDKNCKLDAGERNVCVTCRNKTFSADLLYDGGIRYEGQTFSTPEEFALAVFPKSSPSSSSSATAGAISSDMPIAEEDSGADAKKNDDDVAGGGGAAAEIVNDAMVIQIKICGEPVEYWENLMAAQGRKPKAITTDVIGTTATAEEENAQLDEDTARRWLQQTEKAVSVLESLIDKVSIAKDEEAVAKGYVISPEAAVAIQETNKRIANLRLLKSCIRKLETSIEGLESKVPSTAARPPLDKEFSTDVLKLHWLPWLHAEIEQKLRGSSPEVDEFQEALSKSLEAQLTTEMETTSTVQLARLADYRYQLRHMLSRARDILNRKKDDEQRYYKTCRSGYDQQTSVFESIKDQELVSVEQKTASESSLTKTLRDAQKEEKQLLQQLEKTRAVISSSKEELGRLNDVNGPSVLLLKEKAQRWKDKLHGTHQLCQSAQARVNILEDLNKYMDGIELEKPLTEQLQSHLRKVSTWCCQKYDTKAYVDAKADLMPRCRVRLAYEFFSLVKRLWRGDIPVRVKDIVKLQDAFQSVFLQPESTLMPWEGMPVPLSSTFPMKDETVVKVLHQAHEKISDDIPQGGYYTESPSGDKEAIDKATVASQLAFQLAILAHKGGSNTAGGGGSSGDSMNVSGPNDVMLDVLKTLSSDGLGGGSSGGDERNLRFLIFPESLSLPVPHFLSECLLLVHSQNYLCRLAQIAKEGEAKQQQQQEGGEKKKKADEEKGGEGGAAREGKSEEGSAAAATSTEQKQPGDDSDKMAVDETAPAADAPATSTTADEVKAASTASKEVAAAAAAARKPSSSRPRKHSALVLPWWEEVMTGEKSSLTRCSFADGVKHAALVCKAVDLVMIADPPSLNDKTEELESHHRSTNAVCLIDGPGHIAGRYGAIQDESDPLASMCLINNAAVAVMYSRIIWGIRKVAVVDLDITCYGQGTDEILSGDHDALYASVHVGMDTPADCHDDTRYLVKLQKGNPAKKGFQHTMKEVILPAIEAFFPELIILSTGLGLGKVAEEYLGNNASEEMPWAAKEVSKIAQKMCKGRLVTMLEQPKGGGDDAVYQRALKSHLKGLSEWEKMDVSDQEE